GLFLGADEEHGPVPAADVPKERMGALDALQGFLEVDDVDPGTLPEDEAPHLRIPPSRLVAEVHAGFEQLPSGDDGHGITSCSVSLPRPRLPRLRPRGDPAPGRRACVLTCMAGREGSVPGLLRLLRPVVVRAGR